MFRLDLPVSFLLLFGLLQGCHLALGEDDPFLGYLSFQGLQAAALAMWLLLAFATIVMFGLSVRIFHASEL